jgi:hypothetical protein
MPADVRAKSLQAAPDQAQGPVWVVTCAAAGNFFIPALNALGALGPDHTSGDVFELLGNHIQAENARPTLPRGLIGQEAKDAGGLGNRAGTDRQGDDDARAERSAERAQAGMAEV